MTLASRAMCSCYGAIIAQRCADQRPDRFEHNRTESLALAPLGILSIERRYGSFGSGGQQMPVYL